MKVLIVGPRCSGRTTLASALFGRQNLTRVDRVDLVDPPPVVILDDVTTSWCRAPEFDDLVSNAESLGIRTLVVVVDSVCGLRSMHVTQFDHVYITYCRNRREVERLHQRFLDGSPTTIEGLADLCCRQDVLVHIRDGVVSIIPWSQTTGAGGMMMPEVSRWIAEHRLDELKRIPASQLAMLDPYDVTTQAIGTEQHDLMWWAWSVFHVMPITLVVKALEHGWLDVLASVFESIDEEWWTDQGQMNLWHHAIEFNQVPAMQWLRERGTPWNGRALCDLAAQRRHLAALEWLMAHGALDDDVLFAFQRSSGRLTRDLVTLLGADVAQLVCSFL